MHTLSAFCLPYAQFFSVYLYSQKYIIVEHDCYRKLDVSTLLGEILHV